MNLHKKSKRKPLAEINVVPYIDVMLVLLIIFMVTAPLLTQGVSGDLPQAVSAPLDNQDQEPLVISIKDDGSYYIYMESSSPNYSNKRAILNAPCLDLSSATEPSISFQYHMYGSSAMGSLELEASIDDINWTTIWSRSGNQGNAWLTANVDLSAYNGSILKLRFNGVTGTTWQGDMAIDDLTVITFVPAPTCTDGIQNGDETGVDCGGSSCAPCPTGCTGGEDLPYSEGFHRRHYYCTTRGGRE